MVRQDYQLLTLSLKRYNKTVKRHRKTKKSKRTNLLERLKIAEQRAEDLRLLATGPELKIKTILDKLEIEYIFQYPKFDEWFFLIADFYLPEYKMMIEVDGESHFNPSARKKEAKRKRWLKKDGICVLRIKNKATKTLTSKALKARILRCYCKNNNKKC